MSGQQNNRRTSVKPVTSLPEERDRLRTITRAAVHCNEEVKAKLGNRLGETFSSSVCDPRLPPPRMSSTMHHCYDTDELGKDAIDHQVWKTCVTNPDGHRDKRSEKHPAAKRSTRSSCRRRARIGCLGQRTAVHTRAQPQRCRLQPHPER